MNIFKEQGVSNLCFSTVMAKHKYKNTYPTLLTDAVLDTADGSPILLSA